MLEFRDRFLGMAMGTAPRIDHFKAIYTLDETAAMFRVDLRFTRVTWQISLGKTGIISDGIRR